MCTRATRPAYWEDEYVNGIYNACVELESRTAGPSRPAVSTSRHEVARQCPLQADAFYRQHQDNPHSFAPQRPKCVCTTQSRTVRSLTNFNTDLTPMNRWYIPSPLVATTVQTNGDADTTNNASLDSGLAWHVRNPDQSKLAQHTPNAIDAIMDTVLYLEITTR